MNKNWKLLIRSLVLGLVLTSMTSIGAYAISLYAGGENYNLNWSFNSTLDGSPREFAGKTIALHANSSSAGPGTYAITLYKRGVLSNTKLDTHYISKNGKASLYWYGIVPGKHSLYFGNADRGYWIDGYGIMNSY